MVHGADRAPGNASLVFCPAGTGARLGCHSSVIPPLVMISRHRASSAET
jgi:hypothetical protein